MVGRCSMWLEGAQLWLVGAQLWLVGAQLWLVGAQLFIFADGMMYHLVISAIGDLK